MLPTDDIRFHDEKEKRFVKNTYFRLHRIPTSEQVRRKTSCCCHSSEYIPELRGIEVGTDEKERLWICTSMTS